MNGTSKQGSHDRSLDNSNRNNSSATSKTTTYLTVVLVSLLLTGQFVFFQKCRPAILGSTTSSSTTTTTTTSSGIQGGSFMKGKHFDVCIAGAGLSGAVLAERYASQLGATVLVVEKRDHIGGNCFDYLDVRCALRYVHRHVCTAIDVKKECFLCFSLIFCSGFIFVL